MLHRISIFAILVFVIGFFAITSLANGVPISDNLTFLMVEDNYQPADGEWEDRWYQTKMRFDEALIRLSEGEDMWPLSNIDGEWYWEASTEDYIILCFLNWGYASVHGHSISCYEESTVDSNADSSAQCTDINVIEWDEEVESYEGRIYTMHWYQIQGNPDNVLMTVRYYGSPAMSSEVFKLYDEFTFGWATDVQYTIEVSLSCGYQWTRTPQ